jgi:hypothetical protein
MPAQHELRRQRWGRVLPIVFITYSLAYLDRSNLLMWFVRPERRPPAAEPTGRFVRRTPESEPVATR